jgi:hypothetical protein
MSITHPADHRPAKLLGSYCSCSSPSHPSSGWDPQSLVCVTQTYHTTYST